MSQTLTTRTKDPQAKSAIAGGLLIASALVLVTLTKGNLPERVIDPAQTERKMELRFRDLPDGTVVALDAATGEELERVVPGKGGFIRVTMRSFAAERIRKGFGPEVPFTLARMKGGNLVLEDPLTGRNMLLNAFGPSNEGVFAELIDQKGTIR